MALPLMLTNAINSVYSLTDTFWVGRIDELQVGAVSLVSPIVQFGNAFAMGLAASATALVARRLGQDKREDASHVATLIFEICLIMGVTIAAVCIIFAKPILAWLETPEEIYTSTYSYFIGISFDFLFIFILNVYQAIRQANGDSKTGVYFNSAAGIINIILDPVLMFGLDWGLFGAAMATTLSKAIVSPFAVHSLLTDEKCTKVDFKKYKFDFAMVKEIIFVAIPSSVGTGLSSLGFAFINKYVVSYGAVALSAYGLASKIVTITYIPIYGTGAAVTPFIGYYIGECSYDKLRRTYREALKLMMVVSIGATVFGFLTTRFWIKVFVAEASAELTALATEATYYQVATNFFMGWFSICSAVFNGSGQTRLTLVLQAGRLWLIRIPIIWFFMNFTSIGITGVWWAMNISNILISLLGHAYIELVYYPQMKKRLA